MAEGKPYDVVLVGASGFVGKLATMYLMQHYTTSGKGFRWALSARNERRLRRVHKEIGLADGEVDVLLGDCDDPAFVRSLASKTRVVAASITPYSEHATRLVEACVEAGTHYVDLTGEMLWIRRNIDNLDAKAHGQGIKVVHACGLGSVPADLSVYMMNKQLRQDGVTPTEFKFLMGQVISSLGGGTMNSYANAIRIAKSTVGLTTMLSPALLSPKGTPCSVEHQFLIGYDSDTLRWTAPLWLAGLDAQIVSRSAHLLKYPPHTYKEAQSFRGLFAPISATLILLLSYVFAALLYFWPTRWILTKLRAPGSGPNRILREYGHGKAYLVANGRATDGTPVRYIGEFNIPGGDPGYQETAKMLIESALCLILDANRLPPGGGVLTPAAAFGEVLLDRLKTHTGMELTLQRG